MSDVHVDAVAMRISPDAATFASLPLSLAHRIFLALPVDARLCASYVCRAWRDTLAEPSLWTRLSMSGMHVERRRFFDRMLRSLARRERDQICQLDLSQEDFKESVPLPLLTANAGSLRELHLHSIHPNWSDTTKATFGVVVKAAPLLQVLKVENVRCLLKDALKMLRAEPPYAPLQMSRSLEVYFQDERGELDCGMNRFGRFAPFAAALADATLQPALSRLCVFAADVSPPAVMGALVDAVRVRQLRELALEYGMPPAAAQLVRLLAEGSLAVLEINQPYRQVFAAAGAALVADALRSNTTLTALHLRGVHLCVDMDAALQSWCWARSWGTSACVSFGSFTRTLLMRTVSCLARRWPRSSLRMRLRCRSWCASATNLETMVWRQSWGLWRSTATCTPWTWATTA
jgi:hypothetical protein